VTENPRLAAALAYAARGWHVFPCLPRLKVPATKHGLTDATLDAAQIGAWWQENPDYNVAISTGPSNLFIVDVDPDGESGWDALVSADPALATLEGLMPRVDTPRGGYHFYMAGEGPSTASKLCSGVDTRGKGGYVLAPPSYVDDGKSKGSYGGDPHLDVIPPVHQPLVDMLTSRAPIERPITPPEQVRWDLPETVTRAEAWLKTLVSEGKTHGTYNVCCAVLEMGVSPNKAFELIWEHWNFHRGVPKTEEELRFRIRNAWKYGQETKGGKAQPPLEETFSHLVDAVADELEAAEASGDPELDPKRRYTPKLIGDARKNRPPLEWIIDGLLPRKGIGLLYGPPGTFKTFLLLDLAMSIASGHGPNWWQEGDREPRPVLFLAGESPDALVTSRFDAWLAQQVVPGLAEKIDKNLVVVEGVPPFEMFDYWSHVVGWLKERNIKPALVVIDTLTRAMAGKDENSAKDASWTTLKMEALSRDLGAFVIAVHHTGKDKERGARGSSVWLGNTDFMIEADRPSKANLDVLVHLRKLKEGGDTDLPLKFIGRPHGNTLAFARDWEWKPETELPESTKESELPDWATAEALAEALADSPLLTEHLADTLAHRFGVKRQIILRKLSALKAGRYKPWVPDGKVWSIPEGFTGKKREEF
jgi:hypothetical protein